MMLAKNKGIMLNSRAGFGLIELIVVISIIGILTLVAIPNFKRYQSKSKTVEAKLQLGNIYITEKAFFGFHNTYGACLQNMGYDPTSYVTERYYATGFKSDGVVTGVAGCVVDDTTAFFSAGKGVGNNIITSRSDLPTSSPGEITFKAGVAGIIDIDKVASNNSDQWTIDETKNIHHERMGY